jgi:GNAT superfamily N-acetyltransferase
VGLGQRVATEHCDHRPVALYGDRKELHASEMGVECRLLRNARQTEGLRGTTVSETTTNVTIRELREPDLSEADRIFRLAFGTHVGLPNPTDFMGDASYVPTRWAVDPSAVLAAEFDGDLVGSNFLTRWGSVGFFGPLSVTPEMWNRGVARALLTETMAVFDRWGVRHRGLFTFGESPKHVALYQSYGFLPRFLTPVLSREPSSRSDDWTTYSTETDEVATLSAAAAVTSSIFEGLDVRREIEAVHAQRLGDTVLVYDHDELAAFGVCHVGAGSEAGSGSCYVKFGAARAGEFAPGAFSRLLDACESFAVQQGASTIVAGVSSGRRAAYSQMLARGYRASLIGVTMHLPDVDAYHFPEAYVIDDWR